MILLKEPRIANLFMLVVMDFNPNKLMIPYKIRDMTYIRKYKVNPKTKKKKEIKLLLLYCDFACPTLVSST